MKHFHSLLAVVSAACTLVSATPVQTASISTFNPFKDHTFAISPIYREQALKASITFLKAGKLDLANRATYVATKVAAFSWIAHTTDVPKLRDWLKEANLVQTLTGKKQVVEVAVYNLPDRDCSAKSSAGELSYADGGEEKYKKFIQDVVAEIKKYPNLRVVIGLEADSIGNLVTNLSVPKCGDNAEGQKRSLAYAIAALQLPNVAIYLDGAHAGWLGWEGNIEATAELMGELVKKAKVINPKAAVRGVATNVSNYNGLGNQPQMGYDDLIYVRNLQPLLVAEGIDAHFIVDQGRSGNQNYTRSGLDWCNNKNAGFGTLPTTKTPDPFIDAIVWAKPGGQSDGTSDRSAVRFDEACASETSLQPAPEGGSWFQAYFEQLLVKANPKIPKIL
ncbi:hypothetical protein FRC17_004667 [Serendipita sp. 399]|nr:hypothetical protein FRC17_004667 [Serendipita sp. 399]